MSSGTSPVWCSEECLFWWVRSGCCWQLCTVKLSESTKCSKYITRRRHLLEGLAWPSESSDSLDWRHTCPFVCTGWFFHCTFLPLTQTCCPHEDSCAKRCTDIHPDQTNIKVCGTLVHENATVRLVHISALKQEKHTSYFAFVSCYSNVLGILGLRSIVTKRSRCRVTNITAFVEHLADLHIAFSWEPWNNVRPHTEQGCPRSALTRGLIDAAHVLRSAWRLHWQTP